MQATAEIQTRTMTHEQATDEAVLRLTRKLRRLHPAAHAEIMASLPDGALAALGYAERRADVLRDREGIGTLAFPDPFEGCDDASEE